MTGRRRTKKNANQEQQQQQEEVEDVEMADQEKKDERGRGEEEEEEDEDEEGGIRIGDIYLPPPPPPACTFDSTEPRLIITHIENEFFKSYAEKQILGPFHKNFTSIVGPNGSGKSNVIDSMLFVFGYRAQKIRSKKVSVLIHNSERHPNVQSCTVSVHFQKIMDRDDGGFDVVPDSSFHVSRTAFKDNSSYYQINGRRCQFKAVAKLLRQYGIDLDHNRFLILQGEVEQIAMMKPKAQTEHDTGMLEFLEDIVGSSRFKTPIELLSKRVEDLNEARQEKLHRVKMVEKEKDELEGPKDEAVEHLRLENDITRKRHVLLQYRCWECAETMKKAEEKKEEIKEGMSEVTNRLKELEEKRRNKEEKIHALTKRLEKVNALKEEHSEKFKGLESEDVKLQEDMKHKNQKRKKLMAQLNTDRAKLEELEKVPGKNESSIEECVKLRDETEAKRKEEEETYHKAMTTLNSETQQLQDEKAKHETELIGLRKIVDEAKSALDIAQSELDIYQSTENAEKRRLEQILTGIEKSRSTVEERRGTVGKLEKSIPEFTAKLRSQQERLVAVIPELEAVEDELRSNRVKLEETRSAMHSSRSRGRVMDAVMEQKRNGTLPGVYGRLGDLGGIDERYDVAISTACGALDNIVVDCVETGQKCITFLKRNNIGTATFIALDKMERWRGNTERPMDTPENVPRLYDLVRVSDEKVKTAFYFALRDTLVAGDLEQASRIAYGRVRHRVVTLKGEVIEPAGTMSGGGRSVLRGRMGKQASVVNVDPRVVESAERKVEELTARATELRKERGRLEDSVHQLTKDLKTMKADYQKYKLEIESSEQQLASLEKQRKPQEEKVRSVKSDPARIKEMERVIGDKKEVFQRATEDAESVEKEVTKIHKQIMQVTGGRMKELKKGLDAINKKLEKVNAEITRLQVAIKTSKRNSKKTQDNITSMEKELTEVQEDLRGVQAKRQEIETAAASVLEELKAATQEDEELTTAIGEKKAEREVFVKEENKIKSSKIEIDQELEKYEAVIKENKAKIGHAKKQISKMELAEIPVNRDEVEDSTELVVLEPEHLKELNTKQLEYQVTVLQDKLQESKPNLAVIQEYKKKEEVYLQRAAELEEITNQRDEQRKYHEELRKQRLNEFMAGFTIISHKLKEMYQMITLGGDAELDLVDSLDPFSEGLIFSVRPPNKSWKNITNLSGGEKTLSSLALVFALHYYKPTPLYVMDEIDAALDFKNVSIIGSYIKDRTKNAQFIIISLRSQMFELADRLVGIYKTYNTTKTVAVDPNKIDEKLQENNTNTATATAASQNSAAMNRTTISSSSSSSSQQTAQTRA